MWIWTMSWEPRPLRNMLHLRSIFSRHRFLLINEQMILWSMNWLPYFLFAQTDQYAEYGKCKIFNKYRLCKIIRNFDILMVVLFVIQSWKKTWLTMYTPILYTCISVYNVHVYAGGLRVYVLVLYVSKLWGKNLNI